MKNLEQITKELVQFKTVKGNEEEFKRGFQYIENYFEDTELEINRHEKNGFTTMVVATDEDPDILLHGHLDVVDADEEMFEPTEDEEKIYGRGAADMKAGLACLMKSMKDLSKSGELGSVGLMIVSDEEIGGFNGAQPLAREEYDPEFALSAEPNSSDSEMQIVTHQKGVIRLRMTAEGDNAHGSQPWNGENAAEKLWDKYSEFRENFRNEEGGWTTTVNLGYFESPGAMNVVPDEAEAGLDIRYTDEYTPEEIREDLRHIQGLNWEMTAVDPQLKTNRENKFVEKVLEVASRRSDTELTKKTAASDMRHFSEQDVPTVVTGPKGGSIHGDDEYILKDSMRDFEKIIKEFIQEV